MASAAVEAHASLPEQRIGDALQPADQRADPPRLD
jgi:hypothetical protein